MSAAHDAGVGADAIRVWRKAHRKAGWIFRRMTSRVRRLPDAVIIGAQRCGTTSLHNYLCEHADVLPGFGRKELHFFDRHYSRGLGWYRAHFPSSWSRATYRLRRGRDLMTFESTPYYLFHPSVPARLSGAVPNVKLIAILRNPVDRAVSHYHHEVSRGRESIPLESALQPEVEAARLGKESEAGAAHSRFSYLARGLYARQLEAWYEYVPSERLLVLLSDDLFADPSDAVGQVLSFLDLPPMRVKADAVHNQLSYRAIDPALRKRLSRYFEPHNQRLAELIGRKLRWE